MQKLFLACMLVLAYGFSGASSFGPFIPHKERTVDEALRDIQESPNWIYLVGWLADMSNLTDDEVRQRLTSGQYLVKQCNGCTGLFAGINSEFYVKDSARERALKPHEKLVCIENGLNEACFSTYCGNPAIVPDAHAVKSQSVHTLRTPCMLCVQSGAPTVTQGFLYVPGYYRYGRGYDGVGFSWTHKDVPTTCTIR